MNRAQARQHVFRGLADSLRHDIESGSGWMNRVYLNYAEDGSTAELSEKDALRVHAEALEIIEELDRRGGRKVP